VHEQCRERRTYYFAELHPARPALWPRCHEPRRDLHCRIFVPSRVIGARNRCGRALPGAVCTPQADRERLLAADWKAL
jgi:hypothetical protein